MDFSRFHPILVIAIFGLITRQISCKKIDTATMAADVIMNPWDTKPELDHVPGDVEHLNKASKNMMDLAKLVMHLTPNEAESLEDKIIPKKTIKSHIIFNALTNRPMARNSNLNYTKSNATDGNPVNSSSGIYTVKSPGFYGFIFHAVTNDLKNVLPTVQLRVNNATVATAAAYNGGSFKALTLIAGAKLNRTDQVAIFVSEGSLFENSNGKNRASFAGTFMN